MGPHIHRYSTVGDKLIFCERAGNCSPKRSGCILATGPMYSNLFYSFTIGFVGAILFLVVDKHEPDGPMARLLKFLILFVAGVAILHKLQPYVLALF
jgi:hypothetical protein